MSANSDAKPEEILALVLEFTRDGSGWWEYPDARNAFFYTLLDAGDPAAAVAYHDGNTEKPFTLSAHAQADCVRVRLTAFSEAACRTLRGCLGPAASGLEFRESTTRLIRMVEAPPPHSGSLTFADLANRPPLQTMCMRFETPTSFKSDGRHVPLPVPDLLLGGWQRRWQRWGGAEALEIDSVLLERVVRATTVTRAAIEAEPLSLGRSENLAQPSAFSGRIELALCKSRDAAVKRTFMALCSFAPYCGAGVRNTWGLGLVTPWDGTEGDSLQGDAGRETAYRTQMRRNTELSMRRQKDPPKRMGTRI